MKTLIVLCGLLAPLVICAADVDQLIAKDSNGVIVEVKEKYGGTVIDTCTVVMFHEGQFVLIHRDGASAWFPCEFHSVKVLAKLQPNTSLAEVMRKNQ